MYRQERTPVNWHLRAPFETIGSNATTSRPVQSGTTDCLRKKAPSVRPGLGDCMAGADWLGPSVCFLGTGPPVAQQDEQVFHANVAAAVEVGEAISLLRARPPGTQQEEQILHANVAAAVNIP